MNISEAIQETLKGKRVRNRQWDDNRAFCYAVSVVSPKPTEIKFKPSNGKVKVYAADSADLTSDRWEVVGNHK